ncbi:hypothetical protein EJB05_26511 [Eragrostis curvula]|uniref:Uncharacterized protein n=1 Tax=Eragrostis curvula TaxID=38414 RepID=A0A5J9UJZ5_9POAL|nr:hypothetical protein EJB05_26511 [Eragrostis curvula]
MDPVSSASVGWGISVSGWLVSPIMSNLLTKGFSYLGLSSSEKVEKLERKIIQLKLLLEAADDNPQRETLEQCIKDLKSSFYAAEDILDDIDYHRLKNQVLYQSVGRAEEDVETMTNFDVTIETRTELKEALDKLENLIDEEQRILSSLKVPVGCDYINNAPNSIVRLPTKTTSSPPVVFGRDEDLEIIRKFLRDTPADDEASSSGTNCYSIMGIHGLPGSGKTTLVQHVCEKERDDDYFNLVMWIHVSQNFSMDTIFTEMLEFASGRKRDQFSNFDMLQRELKASLRDKRFLLVLDDVWYDQDASGKLNLLLSLLMVGKMGSRILMTTRAVDAARALGAQYLVTIPDLNEEKFFSMFMHYALDGASIEDEELLRVHQSIGRKIAEKLGRSPLAARIVAGQLKRRLDFDFWIHTMNNDLLNNGTWAALWWSYQQLEEHVKQCFAYCSIFPRRYELQRDELVHLWMAEDFVKATATTEDVEYVVHDCFDVLLSTSFIQLQRTEFGKEYFTIHDMFYDLASKVAGNDCFRIEKCMVGKIPQDVRHLFIVSYDERVFQEQVLNLKSLRTIIISSSTRKRMNSEDFRRMLKSLKKLRVVHLEVDNLSTISPCIGEQKHLRYLALFGKFPILTLPRRFTQLYHLQKFAVRRATSVDYHFSEEIANLVNLRYMICSMFYCPDIGRLTLLRALSVFRVRKERGYEIQQLEHLNNLHGTLRIEWLENVTNNEKAFQAKLFNKVHLSDLVLQWNTDNQSSKLMFGNQDGRQSDEPILTCDLELAEGKASDQSSDSQEDIFEALCPPCLIRSLKIVNYSGSTYPNWFLREQGALENLQYLELSNCYAPPKIGESVMYFRTLVISSCRWYSLPENMERLTWLEKLVIDECENIMSLPILPSSLKVLTLRRWNGSSLPENMERLTSLEELRLQMCDNILSLPRLPLSLKKLKLWTGSSLPENMERLTSLEELTLQQCNNVLSLPRLPLSIKKLEVWNCDHSLWKTCLTVGHPNWQKIAHITEKYIYP